MLLRQLGRCPVSPNLVDAFQQPRAEAEIDQRALVNDYYSVVQAVDRF
jgi:hypothetical protein